MNALSSFNVSLTLGTMNDPGSPLLQRSWSVRHGANTRGGEKGWTQPSHISAAGEAAEILTVYLDDVPQWLQNIHTVLNVNKKFLLSISISFKKEIIRPGALLHNFYLVM